MAASDAKPVPQKNVAYRITFPILDADGDLVTGATGLDSEVSKDGGTFADCTNEATEIATSSGVYYLDLTSTEMNADTVAIIVKTSSSGAKTTTIVLYPEEAGDIRVNVTAFGGTAGTFASGRPEVNTTHWGGTAVASTTVRADLINIAGAAVSTSTAQLGVNVVNFGGSAGTFASGRPAVNASYIGGVPVTATTSITFPAASTVATTTGAVGSVTGAVGSVTGAVGSVTGNVGGNVTGSVGSIATGGIAAASFAAGAIDAAAMSIDGSELTAIPWNASWDAEVQSEVQDAIEANHLDHLIAVADPGGVVANSSFLAKLTSKSATPAFSSYDNTTDSLEALRDNTGTAGAGLTAADDAVITAIAALNNITAASVWAVGTRTLTAGTNIDGSTFTSIPWNASWDAEVQSEAEDALVAHRLDELLNADSDIDGAAPPTVGSVFHELLSKTAGSFTFDQTTDSLEALRDRGDAAWTTATGFSTHSAADVWAAATRTLTSLDEDTTTLDLDATIRSAVGLASANLDTQLDDLPTNAELATALAVADDAVLAAVAALNDLSAAQVNAEVDTALADVGLTTTVTGRIDVAVSTRLASGSYTAPPTAAENADALLGRNVAGGSSTGRTVSQAFFSLRNKVEIVGTTMTVYSTDDLTPSWTATVTESAGANPISAVDPA